MAKKKKNNTFLILVLIAVGIFFLNAFGVFDDFRGLTIIPLESGTTENAPYLCPQNADECVVTGILECNQVEGVQTVKFRTERGSGDCVERCFRNYGALYQRWIAIDVAGFGNLVGFESGGNEDTHSSSRDCNPQADSPQVKFLTQWDDFYFCERSNGNVWGVHVSDTNTGVEFTLSGNPQINLQTTPQEPFSSNGWEVTSGTQDSVSCSGDLKVERAGSTILTEPLSCSSQTTCRDEFTTTIQANDIASIVGGDDYFIEYSAFQFPDCTEGFTQCTADGNGYQTCVGGELTNLVTCATEVGEFCSQTDSGAYCKPKFTLDSFSFRNSQNNADVSAYTPEQSVNIRVRFLSDVVFTSVPATLKIFRDENLINSFSINLNPNEFNFFSVESPDVSGTYTAELELFHDEEIFKIADSTFSISSVPIETSFKADTKLVDEETGALFTSSNNFYTNNPINVEFRVFQAGDTNALIAFDSFDVTATLNGQPVALPVPEISIGLVRYAVVLQNPGLLRFEGKATKSNLQSPLSSKEITVEIPEVRTSFLNVANLVSLIPGTTKTIEFETRSAIGNLVEATQNTVTVLRSGGTEQTITNIQRDNLGKYSFAYTFGQVGDGPSGYQFFVTSQAENHLTSPRTVSPLVNVAPGNEEIVECTSNAQCSGGFECNQGGECVPITGTSPLFYWIIGIAVVAVLIVIVVIIRRRRKPTFAV